MTTIEVIGRIKPLIHLRIEEVLYPQSRIGLTRFLQHYEVEEYTADTFPPVQTLIKAYK